MLTEKASLFRKPQNNGLQSRFCLTCLFSSLHTTAAPSFQTFSRKSHLSRHRRTHCDDAFRYHCTSPGCPRVFTRRDHLRYAVPSTDQCS